MRRLTVSYIHAAIHKNAREGLVFPFLGWLGHLLLHGPAMPLRTSAAHQWSLSCPASIVLPLVMSYSVLYSPSLSCRFTISLVSTLPDSMNIAIVCYLGISFISGSDVQSSAVAVV